MLNPILILIRFMILVLVKIELLFFKDKYTIGSIRSLVLIFYSAIKVSILVFSTSIMFIYNTFVEILSKPDAAPK